MSDEILFSHVLPDGRTAEVMPLTGGRARICVVEIPGLTYSQLW